MLRGCGGNSVHELVVSRVAGINVEPYWIAHLESIWGLREIMDLYFVVSAVFILAKGNTGASTCII